MPTLRCSLGALALIPVLHSAAAAQPGASLIQRLDSIAGSGVARQFVVGSVVAVVKGSDTVLFKAYGKADVEWNVPMATDAMFEIGSIAKQFTAVAILQLRDEGKLSLDDDVARYLPDFDTRGNKVTLRHLLYHTSGIHNFTETSEFPLLVANRIFPRDSAYVLIKRQPFDFPAGSAQLYSNSGYWLLGLVVEKASGLSYEDYVEKRIFQPLGMTRSMYCESYENVERRAHGYSLRGGRLLRAPTTIHTWVFAAGSLCSTAADMVTWLKALHGGKVLSAASYKEMTTPGKLSDWATLRYGMGLGVYKDFNGLQLYEHGGVNAGFWTQINWYPESQTGIVVLQNTAGRLDPEEVAEALAWELLLEGRRPAATIKPFTADPAPFVGKYKGRAASGDLVLDITASPQGLMVSGNGSPPRPLIWLEGSTFRFNAIVLTFHRPGNSGPATAVGFNPGKGVYFIFQRQ
jgi:CubicO group peptidase (beta-lactamase class C family)